MKSFIWVLFFIPFTISEGFSQCEPDTGCVDINEPGQICPDTLPAGQTGVTYNEVVTILPPDSAQLGDQTIALYKIIIDTVTNLPPGLSYIAPETVLYPDSSYCIVITGIPEQAGTFYLKITVIPYVFSETLNQEIAFPATTDSTSLFITIEGVTLVNDILANPLNLIPVKPNPFENETLVGVQLTGYGNIRLEVYNLIGKLIFSENKEGIKGKNFFSFTGRELSPGIYFYSISHKGYRQTGKFVKVR